MSDRLPSGMLVSAMLRRVNDAGGLAVVRARGDAEGGAILILLDDRAGPPRLVERGIGPDGRVVLIDSAPGDSGPSVEDYWRRRRSRDPDLWVIELDIADAERFAAETILVD
ncbi:DUF1491 family protein [Sphingomonas sp. GC_Shp_1]|uniref:DUF1491 family protein n=1 Tax=unclassified Sphingomonas TaxID=196159 RepID=UPI00226A2B82